MKKFLVVFLSVLFVVSMSAVLTGCKKDEHTHVFDKQVASENYFAKEATCLEKAKYYYSCSCGKKGTETFEIGAPLGHSFTNYVSDSNATYLKDGTATAKCDRCSATNTITLAGTKLEDKEHTHVFDKQVASENYFAKEATCLEKAKYYYSCSCGEKGTETFEIGAPLGHSFTNYVSDNNATCSKDGTATAQCDRCDATNTVTLTGTKLDHEFETGQCIHCGFVKQSEGLSYTLIHDKLGDYYEVSGIGSCKDKNVAIPEVFNNLPVKTIGKEAFKRRGLESITIPSSIVTIGFNAFLNCDNLAKVNYLGTIDQWAEIDFENDLNVIEGVYSNPLVYARRLYINKKLVTEIELTTATKVSSIAFLACESLISITLSDSVTTIGNGAFGYCIALTNIIGGGRITSIGFGAFQACESLTNITFNSVTFIDGCAFYNCSSLISITLPDSVVSINTGAFYGCASLRCNEYDNALYLGNSVNNHLFLLKAKAKDIRSCTINENCKFIAYDAFYNCSSLISITIPDSVTSIGNSAFYGCSGLTTITIPDGVTSIGYSVFSGCSSLTSVTIPNSVTSIGRSAFSNCSGLTSIIIPDGVISIGDSAFYGCSGLTALTIPCSVKFMVFDAFYGCSSVTKVNYTGTIEQWVEIFFGSNYSNPTYYAKDLYINDELINEVNLTTATKISDYAFYNCSSLTSINIPDGVISIGDSAFYGCSGLTTLTIPYGITSIGNRAFWECSSLTSITIPDSVTFIGEAAFV